MVCTQIPQGIMSIAAEIKWDTCVWPGMQMRVTRQINQVQNNYPLRTRAVEKRCFFVVKMECKQEKKNFDTCVRVSSIAGYTAKNMLQISLEKMSGGGNVRPNQHLKTLSKKLSVL